MKSENYKISILIPVYNKGKYIERCISSVINQTYRNIECLIIDDFCTDDSIEKAHSITDKYDGQIVFCYITHEKNRGVSAARNTGIMNANGEYIFYLDADDEISVNCIELLVEKVLLYPDVDIVQGNVKRIPKGNDYYELKRFGFPEIYSNNESIRTRYYDVRKGFPINVTNKLFRTDFIRKNNLLFLEGIIHEDDHWMSKAIKVCNSMTFEYGYTYYHHIVSNSIMTSTSIEKSAHSWGILLCDIINHFEEKDFILQFKRNLREFAHWYSLAPCVLSMKTAHRAFQEQAFSHGLYYISLILFISRFISFSEFGRKVGRHLTNLWIYRT